MLSNYQILAALVGQIPLKIEHDLYELIITTQSHIFKLYHDQDCCEQVELDDIIGDLQDLVGRKIVRAEEVTNIDSPNYPPDWLDIKARAKQMDNLIKNKPQTDPWLETDYSNTWTFYKLDGERDSVTLRWHGTSNGYYSESISIDMIERKESSGL